MSLPTSRFLRQSVEGVDEGSKKMDQVWNHRGVTSCVLLNLTTPSSKRPASPALLRWLLAQLFQPYRLLPSEKRHAPPYPRLFSPLPLNSSAFTEVTSSRFSTESNNTFVFKRLPRRLYASWLLAR
ncbi:hypothetical protein H5410_064999 [Solanum commersonii]|uniref:Uncharacterized protein n=1 Tax=Solanum commersonii TaxID=4109 RepID=A0A9J5VYD2_SOLCO|nr:hypothetical protein H5410_064999 [Solanum commersonii]